MAVHLWGNPKGTKRTSVIHTQSASPEVQDRQLDNSQQSAALTRFTPRRTKSLPSDIGPSHQGHKRKRSVSSELLETPGSIFKMSSSSSRHSSSSPRKLSSSSSSSKKSKSSPKDLDWTDVTDPEERRRIQNRIAQRKFREKARENKERAERDSRNQEYAGNSYRIPSPHDFTNEEVSGLPWGSVSFGHFVTRGQEAGSRQSSGRGTYVGDETFSSVPYTASYSMQWTQPASYGGSSGGDEAYYDDFYLYDPTTGQGR